MFKEAPPIEILFKGVLRLMNRDAMFPMRTGQPNILQANDLHWMYERYFKGGLNFWVEISYIKRPTTKIPSTTK